MIKEEGKKKIDARGGGINWKCLLECWAIKTKIHQWMNDIAAMKKA